MPTSQDIPESVLREAGITAYNSQELVDELERRGVTLQDIGSMYAQAYEKSQIADARTSEPQYKLPGHDETMEALDKLTEWDEVK